MTTTTADLEAALAEVEATAKAADIQFDDAAPPSAAAGVIDDDTNENVATIILPFVDAIMDMTVGRFQAVQHSPTAVPPFLTMARAQVEAALKECAAALRHGGLAAVRGLSQLQAAQHAYEECRESRNRLRASENFLRSIGSELIADVSAKSHQVLALQGSIVRRDRLLRTQRRAYLRELTHLRNMIRDLRTKGATSLSDGVFHDWDREDVGMTDTSLTDEDATEALLAEERSKHAKELEAQEAKFAKSEEELRRQIVSLEWRLRHRVTAASVYDDRNEDELHEDTAATVFFEDAACFTGDDVFTVDATVQCGDVDDDGNVDNMAAATKVSLDNDASPDAEKGTHASSRHLKRRAKHHQFHSPAVASRASRSTPLPDGAIATPSLQQDQHRLQSELSAQIAGLDEVRRQLKGKAETLTEASRQRIQNDAAHRTTERQIINVLHETMRAKDRLLDQKSKELAQLEDETRRWFEQYRLTQPPDQVPVNFAHLRHVAETVEIAERKEEAYRIMSWALLALNVKSLHILEGLRADTLEAERLHDVMEVRRLQRAFDSVSLLLRQRAARMRFMRVRCREDANRAWDQVLYYARLLHHPAEALQPPPRYYAPTDSATAASADHAVTLERAEQRRRDLVRALDLHSKDLTDDKLLSQQIQLGPAAGPASHPPLDVTVGGAVTTPRGTRPFTAPTTRQGPPAALKGPPSPFVLRMRHVREPSGAAATRLPDHPLNSNPRPASAAVAPHNPASNFTPGSLRGLTPAMRRQQLLNLVRQDQDSLSADTRRHIVSMQRHRQLRKPPLELSRGSEGFHMTRLYGRAEQPPPPST